jgi:diacylglycerol O-acyltransferase / wax synthase
MANPDRLSGLDSSFLHLEGAGAHMHVAACAVLQGPAPDYQDLVDAVDARLHLVPRYRQRLAFVPLQQGRPVWVDDPHFQIAFHVRHTALPRPGGEAALRRLAGRVFSQALDRNRPLWEIWLVEGLQEERFALLFKTHHALVDGISGVDVATVLFDLGADAAPPAPAGRPWTARPLPTAPQLLADALIERATVPTELVRGARAVIRGPRHVATRVGTAAVGLSAMAWSGLRPAPRSPFNVRIGPHRRFTWASFELADLKAIKNEFDATVNDVVLTAVAGALGRYMRRRGESTDGVVLRAMVPVSIRVELEQSALGNRVAAMWAPLPVGIEDPEERLDIISEAMVDAKASGQAVGAQLLTELPGFAPPTIVAQAARLQARQRVFNLVVTNVPGPQMPLYVLGRKLLEVYPMVPLAENTALGIALLSYNGSVFFGFSADFDAIPDLDLLAEDLRAAIDELRAAAGADLHVDVA